MAAKKSTNAEAAPHLALRKARLAPGKKATIKTNPGFGSAIVLSPVGVSPTGGIAFAVAMRVSPPAGRVSFIPKGKETLVIDADGAPSNLALERFVRRVWDKKGGDPPTVVDFGHGHS